MTKPTRRSPVGCRVSAIGAVQFKGKGAAVPVFAVLVGN